MAFGGTTAVVGGKTVYKVGDYIMNNDEIRSYVAEKFAFSWLIGASIGGTAA